MDAGKRHRQRKEALNRVLASQFGLIGYAQLQAIGLTPRQTDLKRVYKNVYRSVAVPRSWKQRLMAAYLWAGSGTVVSHRAAARLLGLDGIDVEVIELTTTKGLKPPADDVLLHRTTELHTKDVAWVGPIPVTTPTRTLIDLGAVLDEETLEIAMDCALRKRMTTIDRLRRRVEELSGKGRRGVALIKKLLADRTPGERPPESVLETKTKRVLRILRRAGLPLPVCQYVVGPYRVDFAYPELKIAIEAESAKHHFDLRARDRDWKRRNYLTSRGWLVLHFTWEDITMHPERVVAEVRRALALRLQDAR